MDPSRDIEHQLLEQRAANLPSHFVLPYYDAYSIVNIAPTLARILGTPMKEVAPALPPALWAHLGEGVARIILVILDALGYRQFERHLRSEPSVFRRLVEAGTLFPITSVFPSTTVAALTSIWTGRPPLGHGFLGTKLLLPKQGVLANLLKMRPAVSSRGGRLEDWGWSPDDLVVAPTLAGQLGEQGVKTVAHTRRSFLGSTLTQIFLRGMEDIRGYLGLSDLWLNVRQTLREADPDRPLLVDVYWSDVDNIGHVYGPESPYAPATLRHLARSLEEDFLRCLTPEMRAGTLMVITADHGQIATPPDRVVHLPEHDDLWDTFLLPPAGESRAAYIYARPDQRARLHDYVAEHFRDRFLTLDTDRALDAGLWGPSPLVTPETRVRLGDVVMIAQDDSRLTIRPRRESTSTLRGHHGSLTAEEMLVPMLIARLDQLSLPACR